MASFIAQRAVRFVAVLFTITALSFAFLHAIPGNPIQILLGEHATKSDVERLTHELRLDQPWYVQLGAYLWQVGQGNLGRSLADDVPVSTKLAEHFPATIELTVAAMLFALLVGIPAGIVAALNHRSIVDTFINVGVLVGVSVPVFWLGWMMLYVFAYEPSRIGMDLFPIGGRVSLRYAFETHTHFVLIDALLAGDWAAFGDALRHLVLPAVTLGTIPLAIIAKMTRASMLDVQSMDYMRTARAKGLGSWAVVMRHGLRNALIPIITVAGLQTGLLLGGAVLTEHIFAWPGVGRLAFEAISNRDSPLVNGSILLFAATFVFVNLGVDIAYAMANPRIRYS
ncbi:MAG: ABC transporter permease [Candidatus Eremiobacteraeota bacterium]|nr:ABC transporter permease [Candidatus Eremiobacteraeota bacterium]MBV8223500.1 ABC transporter permease [Candidatus Eremiobacteraeota bacterium]